jgi:OmpA-OmpF porin, OOP family
MDGCLDRSDPIDRLPPSSSEEKPFAVALAEAYQRQADVDRAAGSDPDIVGIYVYRVQLAAHGRSIGPLVPGTVTADDGRQALVHAMLVDRLTPTLQGGVWGDGTDQADVQVSYECWLLHGAEYPPTDPTAADCWERLSVINSYFHEIVQDPVDPAAFRRCTQALDLTDGFVMLFDWGSSEIAAGAFRLGNVFVVHNVACEVVVAFGGRLMVSIEAHTDTSEASLELSIQRAEAIRDALIAEGVDPSAIEIEGRGDSNLAVPTAPGVRNQANRYAVLRMYEPAGPPAGD